MQDWDRLMMILLGGGVAIYTGYTGWRSWKEKKKKAALGAFLLAAVTALMPLALAMFGG